jgi:hypothetical protein
MTRLTKDEIKLACQGAVPKAIKDKLDKIQEELSDPVQIEAINKHIDSAARYADQAIASKGDTKETSLRWDAVFHRKMKELTAEIRCMS